MLFPFCCFVGELLTLLLPLEFAILLAGDDETMMTIIPLIQRRQQKDSPTTPWRQQYKLPARSCYRPRFLLLGLEVSRRSVYT